MSVLVPCPGCARHVRSSESACPFCSAELPSNLASRAVPAANRRLSRAAAFTFAATVAVGSAAACSSSSDSGGVGVPYGVPAPDDGGGIVDDGGGAQPLYGLAADSGLHAVDGGTGDDGGAASLYGLPIEDSGIDHD